MQDKLELVALRWKSSLLATAFERWKCETSYRHAKLDLHKRALTSWRALALKKVRKPPCSWLTWEPCQALVIAGCHQYRSSESRAKASLLTSED